MLINKEKDDNQFHLQPKIDEIYNKSTLIIHKFAIFLKNLILKYKFLVKKWLLYKLLIKKNSLYTILSN
mgnify:CR=1 FL=1